MKKIYIFIAIMCAIGISNMLLAQTQTTYYVSVTDNTFDLSTTDANDIVIIEAGARNHIYFSGIPVNEGLYTSIAYPVTIKNENCTTKVLINSESIKDYLIKFDHVENVRLTGTGSSSFDYGIELTKQQGCTLTTQHGIVIGPYCNNIEIDHIYIHDILNDGIQTAFVYDANDQGTWYSDDPNAIPGTDAKMEHINVHHNKIEQVKWNGIILGNKDVNIAHPYQGVDYFSPMMRDNYIYHNTMVDTELDGIALYGEIGKGYIYGNYIREYGYSIPSFDKDTCPFAAIVVGLKSSHSLVYNNVVRYGKGHGIYDCSRGGNQYYNNIITEAGFYNTNTNYTISAIHIDNVVA